MTKQRYQQFFVLILIAMQLLSFQAVQASTAYNTYTKSVDGDLIKIQTAYEATEVLASPKLKKIEDVTVHDGRLYGVDAESKQIFIMDLAGNVEMMFGADVLQNPTGIDVDASGQVYVADPTARQVVLFDQTGTVLKTFERPDEPLFGKSEVFKPYKLTVDVKGNLFIVGQGATNGIIQLNANGDFLGYFGANFAEMSTLKKIQNTVMSELQRGKTLRNVPAASTNIDIDEMGIVYTVTQTASSNSIKKLNVAGANLLSPSTYAEPNAIDITVGKLNNFYVLTSDRRVIEYDSTGEVLFAFGSQEGEIQRLGIFKSPSALAVDEDGTLYISDAEGGGIHRLVRTDFAKEVHNGVALLEEGRYVESKQYWESVARLNGSFALAHIALGRAHIIEQEYEQAKDAFYLANHREGYSKAFWETRRDWMETYLGRFLAILLFVFFGWVLLKKVHTKTNVLYPLVKVKRRITKIRLIQQLGLLFKMFRHPLDTLYGIKRQRKSSVGAATIWFAVLVIEFILFQYFVGFIFNQRLTETMNIVLVVGILVLGLLLFIGMNYLISTINDGEGSLQNVYIATAYSFAPLIVGLTPIILISNVLTINEAFLYQFALMIAIGWTLLLLFIMVKEIHYFTFWETVKNIALTLFSSMVAVAVGYILFILVNQMFMFLNEIFQEVLARV